MKYGNNTAPCLNCPNRSQGCHSSCEVYKVWKHNHEQEKAEIRSKKLKDAEFGNAFEGSLKRSCGFKQGRR